MGSTSSSVEFRQRISRPGLSGSGSCRTATGWAHLIFAPWANLLDHFMVKIPGARLSSRAFPLAELVYQHSRYNEHPDCDLEDERIYPQEISSIP